MKFTPRRLDVCLAAAAMACRRETTKIEAIAARRYTVDNQMRALAAMAVLAAAPSGLPLPSANSLAAGAFRIDAARGTEVPTAVVRQNQKHALLFAGGDAGQIRTGDWRPGFLNPWIRDALLVWSPAAAAGAFHSRDEFLDAVVSAEDAGLAFASLLSELSDYAIEAEIASAFNRAPLRPSTAANHWTAWCGRTVDRPAIG